MEVWLASSSNLAVGRYVHIRTGIFAGKCSAGTKSFSLAVADKVCWTKIKKKEVTPWTRRRNRMRARISRRGGRAADF